VALALALTLRSDTTFGRGDGVAGLVDAEVEHDAATGLPQLNGRTLKGLLVDECSNLLFAAESAAPAATGRLSDAAVFLFGSPGSAVGETARLHVGPALLPDELRTAVLADVRARRLSPAQVLESLTSIRRQTAVSPTTGAPARNSLRSVRVILREVTFTARLEFLDPPDTLTLALLAASTLCLRRLGLGRNRGRGRVQARLVDAREDVTWERSAPLRSLLQGGAA